MKKKFKIICIFLTGAAVLLGLFMSIDMLLNRLRGSVIVTVDGEGVPVERVVCIYVDGSEGGREEKVTYGTMIMGAGTAFKNRGNRYGMYEYSFPIFFEKFNIEPKIRLFKTNWYEGNLMDIDIKIYGDDGVWNADVSVVTKLTTYQETFYDIENNAIEMRVE